MAGLPGVWRCCGRAVAGVMGQGGRAAGSAGVVPPAALYGKFTDAGSRSPRRVERRKQKNSTARHMLRRHDPV